MRTAAATALLTISLLPFVARAQDAEPTNDPASASAETDQTAAVADMKRQLEGDPGLQQALVDRIMHSKIAASISVDPDHEKQRSDVSDWVKGDLGSAAEIALGLSRDEAEGTHNFENGLVKHLKQTFRRGNTDRGAFGVLKGAGKTSKQMGLKQNEEVGEEERRERLKNLFEGKGAQSERIITGKADDDKPKTESTANASLANSFYDRLSAGNIRGYSPQLMALQSSLNTRRPPGAPALIETGKLDFATLAYPAYGLKYDLGNVEERLRRARIAELATLAGVRLTERDMKDPDLETKLLAKVPADKLPKRFASRAAANARARAALDAFIAAAEKSKDPAKITKALLVELSGRQREASRWLVAASLEEELARVESEEDFLTADLLAAIDAVPAAAPVRESYKRRGQSFKERVLKLKANAQSSLDALQSDSWLSRVAEIEKTMTESANLRRTISRDISDYRLVPYRAAEAVVKQPRWREILDDVVVKYLKATSYGREVAARRGRLARYLSIFGQIASGDLDGAHLSLVNAEPGRK